MFISPFFLLVVLFNSTAANKNAAMKEEATYALFSMTAKMDKGKTIIAPGSYNSLKSFHLCGRAYIITIIVPEEDGEKVKVSVTRNTNEDHPGGHDLYYNMEIYILDYTGTKYITMYAAKGSALPSDSKTNLSKKKFQKSHYPQLNIQAECNLTPAVWEAYLTWIGKRY